LGCEEGGHGWWRIRGVKEGKGPITIGVEGGSGGKIEG